MTLDLIYDASFNRYGGHDAFTLTAGKAFKIQTPGTAPVDRLNTNVTAGKVWDVSIHVTVEERNA